MLRPRFSTAIPAPVMRIPMTSIPTPMRKARRSRVGTGGSGMARMALTMFMREMRMVAKYTVPMVMAKPMR